MNQDKKYQIRPISYNFLCKSLEILGQSLGYWSNRIAWSYFLIGSIIYLPLNFPWASSDGCMHNHTPWKREENERRKKRKKKKRQGKVVSAFPPTRLIVKFDFSYPPPTYLQFWHLAYLQLIKLSNYAHFSLAFRKALTRNMQANFYSSFYRPNRQKRFDDSYDFSFLLQRAVIGLSRLPHFHSMRGIG